jgi:hypothetical protein
MVRVSIFVAVCLLLQACDDSQDVTVQIHVEGAQESRMRFDSFERAAEWVSQSCESLWHQAKSNGNSQKFHIVAFGPRLAGIVESPRFGFESSSGKPTRLIQFDETYGDSAKIEGYDLQCHAVERYIKQQIVMNSVFGAQNQKPRENPP